MAVINKIILNDETYDIQDESAQESVQDLIGETNRLTTEVTEITTAINGKSTADISYNEDDSSLDITTGTIAIPAVTTNSNEEIEQMRRDGNQISAVRLNGTSYNISGGNDLLTKDVVFAPITIPAGTEVKMTPYVTDFIPYADIVSVTPLIGSGFSYPVAFSIAPGSSAEKSLFVAAIFTNGLDPVTLSLTLRVAYKST